MQSLATENNQAETAFLCATGDPLRFGLRWFTPLLEVPLCGHATLAAGHVLLSEIGGPGERLAFDTRSGPLTVVRAGRGYEMDFPSCPPQRIEAPAGLAEALGAEPLETWAAQYLVAVMETEEAVRGLAPDVAKLKELSGGATNGPGNLGVAAVAEPAAEYDVVSRFFAPGSGIHEDAATGSLHCILAPLFTPKLGRDRLRFHQAYPGRGADLECEVSAERVLLRGQAITIVEGKLRVQAAGQRPAISAS